QASSGLYGRAIGPMVPASRRAIVVFGNAYPRRARRIGGQMTEQPPADMTALPDLLHGRGRSGPVRQRRPGYVDLLPPGNAGCPAGENIQAWLAHAQVGRHEQAWRQLVADNPLAAIHGRVCYHPCESVCNRARLDSAVSIHAVERVLGDLALERGWAFDPPPAPWFCSPCWRSSCARRRRETRRQPRPGRPLRRVAVLTTGVEDATDVARYLLAGADVVMTASALLRHEPGYAGVLLEE